jgi:hypothetical protein
MKEYFIVIGLDDDELSNAFKRFRDLYFTEHKNNIDVIECEYQYCGDNEVMVKIVLAFNAYYFKDHEGHQVQEVGYILRNKGLQPFYINGCWLAKQVWYVDTILHLQNNDTVYNRTNDELLDKLNNYILTC